MAALFADDTVLPVNGLQLGLLKQAASKQWKNVEPAIFGTLLQRSLDPAERHALGAHFTPRAYVERLVLPTIIEPFAGGMGKCSRRRHHPRQPLRPACSSCGVDGGEFLHQDEGGRNRQCQSGPQDGAR
jgi:hypothetical protein